MNPRAQHAYLMIEVLVYIGMVFLLLGVGYIAMYRCIDNSVALRRNADDITTVLHVGERWRADVRSSAGTPQIESSDSEQILHLPSRGGEVLYLYSNDALFRRYSEGPWVQVLTNLKSSVFTTNSSKTFTAFNWDLELAVKGKSHRTKPLFSFIGAQRASTTP